MWFIYLNAVVLPVIMPLIYIYEPVAGVGRNTRGKNVLSKDRVMSRQRTVPVVTTWILDTGRRMLETD